MKRTIKTLLIFFVATLFLFGSTLPSYAAAQKNGYVNVNSCYSKLNSYRRAAGRKALARNATLEKHAKTRAKEIVRKFSHTRPNGKSALSIIKGNLWKGENIAMGQTSCAQVMSAWYHSSGHRANMLRPQFRKVGIAGYRYNGRIYWVQLFSS